MLRSWSARAPWTVQYLAHRKSYNWDTRTCAQTQTRRFKHDDASANIRNLAVVAHIDSGKTTLTESILYTTDYLSTPGSVDTGSTTTDFLPAERERGITIQSASVPIRWKEWKFNLIDTPGHADFGMEVESASRVVDGAVVLIDAVEGVEAQTRGVWGQLDRYKVPSRLLFLNKLDRPGASFRSSILSVLSHRLHRCPLPITIPIASLDAQAYKTAEPGLQGIVDLVKWRAWIHRDGEDAELIELPRSAEFEREQKVLTPEHPLVPELLTARTALLDTLCMHSEDLMNMLLSSSQDAPGYLEVSPEPIISALRAATLQGQILPVLCGSALNHIGTETVLDYAGHLLASPNDLSLVPHDDGFVQMLAWKVSWDSKRGWMTFVRIYSGTLKRQTTLLNTSRNVREKAHKLLLLYANQPEEVEMLTFGSVGVVLGLKHTRTGDTLTSVHPSAKSSLLPDISPPPAVMSLSIVPQSSSDTQTVQDALIALSRTDPSARVETTEGQMLVHGLGALHLEIVENRLRNEWNVKFESGRRHVAYREGLGDVPLEINEMWDGLVVSKQLSARIQMRVRSMEDGEIGDPHWSGNIVVDKKGKPVPPPSAAGQTTPYTYIAQGIFGVLYSSPHTSLPMTRLHIEVLDYVISDEANLPVLSRVASTSLRKAVLDAGRGPVLEPYVHLNVSVSEEHAGSVIKDITENHGVIQDLAQSSSSGDGDDDTMPHSSEGLYIPPSWVSPSSTREDGMGRASRTKRVIHATAPLSRMLDFAMRLRSLTAGHGTFEMSNAYFHVAAPERQLEILRELGKL